MVCIKPALYRVMKYVQRPLECYVLYYIHGIKSTKLMLFDGMHAWQLLIDCIVYNRIIIQE